MLAPIPGLQRDGKAVAGLNPETFRGAVSVLNVWASWCVPCHDEAPILHRMSADKSFQIVGINYKGSV